MEPHTKPAAIAARFSRWLAVAVCLLAFVTAAAAQQPGAGAVMVGTEALVQTGAAPAPGEGPDAIGWLGAFQQSFGANGVLTLSLDSSSDGANWRNGNNQLAWRNLPFAGGRWFLRAGTLNLATDLLPVHFASLYSPDVYLSGGALDYHLGPVRFSAFAGRELIQQGPYLPFFISSPSAMGGLQALVAVSPRLWLEARYIHSRASGPAAIAVPLLGEPPAVADNVYLDGDYHLGSNDDWLGELSFSRARPAWEPLSGEKRNSLSYFLGPAVTRPHFDLQAYVIRQSDDYLPLANYISGDRTGAFASLDIHPGTLWSASATLSDFHAGASGPAAFASSDALSTSAALSLTPGDGYSLTASGSRGLISPLNGMHGPALGLTTAQLQAERSYGDNRSYLRYQDWISSSTEGFGNSSIRTTSFEQDRLLGSDSLSAMVGWQQSSGGAVTLISQLGGNLALGRWLSLAGSAQIGHDLRDQTALSLETYRTVMLLATAHLPSHFELSAEWIHNASVSELNPARVLVGMAAGPVPLLPALSQQILFLRLTKTIHWGHGMPLLAGMSEASAERMVPTYSTVSGVVFNDRLGTGHWAPGDSGVPGITVTLSGRTAVTDARGRFEFPAVRSGEYRLALDPDRLPAQYSAPDAAPQTLRVGARATPRIAIPIQEVGAVTGRVTANGQPLAGAELRLFAVGAPAAALFAFSNAQGYFAFQDVLPGTYRLGLDFTSVSAGASLAAPLPPLTLASGGSVQGIMVQLRAPVRNPAVHTTVEAAESIFAPPPPEVPNHSCAVVPPAAAAPLASPSESLARSFRRNIGDVYFAFARWSLDPAARQTLRRDAAWLRAHPAVDVLIQGLCDDRGSAAYNRRLGARRAHAARKYLIRLGVDAARIAIISFGKGQRFCTQSIPACWQSNRRDHIVIAVSGR